MSGNFYKTCVFFGKTAFAHTFTCQPCYLIPPKRRWHIYLSLNQIWAQSQKVAIDGGHRIWSKTMGYWLTLSVWPRMTSRLQWPSERFAGILCLLAKGWGRRWRGLWPGPVGQLAGSLWQIGWFCHLNILDHLDHLHHLDQVNIRYHLDHLNHWDHLE